jgi:hypothetical protein
MADSLKGYVIPAGATRIMEMQVTKLAQDRARGQNSDATAQNRNSPFFSQPQQQNHKTTHDVIGSRLHRGRELPLGDEKLEA